MTNSDRLPLALLTLTGVTGVIDAVSFLGLGRVFTANMTGNVVLLGFAVAGAPGHHQGGQHARPGADDEQPAEDRQQHVHGGECAPPNALGQAVAPPAAVA